MFEVEIVKASASASFLIVECIVCLQYLCALSLHDFL